jgi:tripartite-type tricarboxylate transporter receptor subunit TctC
MVQGLSFALITALLTCLIAGPAWSQAYPARPIRTVVPQPAGGSMDSNARALGEQLARVFGQNIVIDNRGGANGIIAGEMVAKAAPDGYTVLYTSNSFINNQLVQAQPPFDILRDFAPITNVANLPGYLILVNAQVPARSMKDLIDLSKGTKAMRFGSGGIGNSQHLLGELINARAGTHLMHVPYKGFAPMITALLGNEVQVAFGAPTTVIQHIKSGRLRVLAITAAKRWPGMPDMPTTGETLPGFVYEAAWHGMFAPAATPKTIIARLQTEVARAMRIHGVREHFENGGYVPLANTPDEFRRFLESELKNVREYMRIAHIEAQ